MFYPHIKSEAEASPDLSPLHHFHFKFPPSHDHSSNPPDHPTPLYRFGSYQPISPTNHHHPYMSYSDDYDDLGPYLPGQLDSATERTVRRRSSKACDQCRKSKCKCERSGPNEPCKSCIMLGTPCTFLGPSRKRGPPKGYIDAIEARLHQTEALVGIMLSTKDPRAQSLLQDIAQARPYDPLAKEIISRVDNSQYGVKGRKRASDVSVSGSSNKKPDSPTTPKEKGGGEKFDLTSTHPSNEWQDKVINMLGAGRTSEPAYARVTLSANNKPSLRVATCTSDENAEGRERQRRRLGDGDYAYNDINPSLPSPASTSASVANSAGSGPREEDVARDGEEEEKLLAQAVGELSLNEDEEVRYHGQASGLYLLGVQERVDKRNEGGIWRFPGARVWPPLPSVTESRGNGELDDGEHAASPLSSHVPERGGGSVPSPVLQKSDNGPSGEQYLPPRKEQERLLELYFTFVQPSFPVVHKKTFWEVWRNRGDAYPLMKRKRRIPPLLLLAMFALAARYDISPANSNIHAFPSPPNSEISSSTAPLPTDGVTMWTAGEEYFSAAKRTLDTSYASSRANTCQALLLMGYREIGIGAMALAWTYVGMAIRMAQDLGMHRKAEGWRRPGLGQASEASATMGEEGRIFGNWELGERRRIWFGCVIMDKYVSAYIGRPLMISEKDFDTEFPELTESEEMEDWKSIGVDDQWTAPVPGRVVSCFNKSAELSGILSAIIQAIYAVRPFPSGPGTLGSPVLRPASRLAETEKQAAILEGVLNKWYFDLPEHLRYDTAVTPERDASSNLPTPHVLMLHMQYWCAVLLLHRPFIRRALKRRARSGSDDQSDSDDLGLITSRKSYELCASAANHITSIVTAYRDRYPLNRCSVFLCYYVFTASIMHVISVSAYPDDPQAHINLRRCLQALSAMRYVWPSAGRALELLSGAKVNLDLDPGATASSVNSNNPLLRKDDTLASNGQKRKSTFEDNVQESITLTPAVGGVINTTGEYVTPIHSGVAAQAPPTIPCQTPRRDLTQVVTTRPIRPHSSFNTVTDTYAIQPPSLLAATECQWTDDTTVTIPSNASPVLTGDESHVRIPGRQLSPGEDSDFGGPLSTSVLPQLYSTGLVDDHNLQHTIAPPSHHNQGPHHHSHGHPQSQAQYHQPYSHVSKMTAQVQDHSQPQYWSDYSTFSQLGTTDAGAYGGLEMGIGSSSEIDLTLREQPRHTQHHQHMLSQQSQHPNVTTMPDMYLSTPYEPYGACYR